MRRSTKYFFTSLGILSLLSPFALASSAYATPSSKSVDMVAFEENGSSGVGNYMVGINANAGITNWGSSNLTNWTKPTEFELGDLNNDGRMDIVAFEKTSSSRGNYMLGINVGNNKFAWIASNLHDWAIPTQFRTGDLNGDGFADIMAYEPISGKSNTGTFRVGINLGNNKNFSWLDTNLQDWESVTKWQLADMDGDGRADIVAFQTEGAARSSGNYYVGVGLTSNNFSWGEILGGFLPPHGLEVGDLNNDGRNDFVATEAASSGHVNYMEATATGQPIGGSLGNPSYHWSSTNLTNWSDPYSFQVGDLFKDGKADIFAAESQGNGQVNYYQGNNKGNGQFSWGPRIMNFQTPLAFRLGNLDDQ